MKWNNCKYNDVCWINYLTLCNEAVANNQNKLIMTMTESSNKYPRRLTK